MGDRAAQYFEDLSLPTAYRERLEPVMFRPFAERLADLVTIEPGAVVLDVASGTGVVARAAALRAGAAGRVIASDISAPMLSHVTKDVPSGSAAIETIVCPAAELQLDEGSVDVVLCQQGLQFFPDPVAALIEIRRVLRPRGSVALAIWLRGAPLEPFDSYALAMREAGIAEPFPGAYESSAFSMSPEEVKGALTKGGYREVVANVDTLELVWESPQAAAAALFGSIYGPPVAALDEESRQKVMSVLQDHMTAPDGSAARQLATTVLARGTKP